MKFSSFTGRGVGGGLLPVLMAAAMVLLVAPPARSQVYPTTFGVFTGTPTTITNEVTVLVTNTAVAVRADRGLAVLPNLTGLAASTANVTYNFNVSADGTNYTTTNPLTYAVALNLTTNVIGYKLFYPDLLNNVRYIKLTSIANAATNGVTLGVVQYSYFNP